MNPYNINIYGEPPVQFVGPLYNVEGPLPAQGIRVLCAGSSQTILGKIIAAREEGTMPTASFAFNGVEYTYPVVNGALFRSTPEGDIISLLLKVDPHFVEKFKRRVDRSEIEELRDALNAYLEEEDDDDL